mmetsp:Transcript_71951/g.203178  ORF Transcript_71951/g.203178 Transcript_71951/m.203178 type:complete len:207 (+) Transcript_71951:919-1539(+)
MTIWSNPDLSPGALSNTAGRAMMSDSSSLNCLAMPMMAAECALPPSALKTFTWSATTCSIFAFSPSACFRCTSPLFCAASASLTFAFPSTTAFEASSRADFFAVSSPARASSAAVADATAASWPSLVLSASVVFAASASTARCSLSWMPVNTWSIIFTTTSWCSWRSSASTIRECGIDLTSISRHISGRPSAFVSPSRTPAIIGST